MVTKEIDLTKYIDYNNPFYKLWNSKEKKDNLPKYLNEIKTMDYNNFEKLIRSSDKKFANNLSDSLLNGDVYLLKNAYNIDYLNKLKKETANIFKNSESSFHKIIENCPNFHRNISGEHAEKYAFHQIKHTHYFFPWNDDFFDLYKETYKRWKLFKFISGYYENCWENNSPKDGIVDRIQIVKYPPDSGEVELHQDPYIYQKFFISVYMSKRDKDYKNGGLYLINKYKEKVELEKKIDVGDLAFGFGTILHGVNKSSAVEGNNENDISGRWFMGLYSTVSDYVTNRHTGKAVKIN